MRFIGVAMLATAVLSGTGGLAQSVSPGDYRKLTCSELAQEGRAISKRGFILSGLEAGAGGRDGNRESTGDCDRLARNLAGRR